MPQTVPTPDQIKGYALQLPPIYRDILTAFQDAVPGRRAGEEVAAATIRMHLTNHGSRYELREVIDACRQLEEEGFLEEVSRAVVLFAPTPLGEALIEAITGHAALPRTVPELPKPTW